jgi:large subunit ribosomal protein L18
MIRKIKKLYLQGKKRYLKKIVGTNEKPRLSVFKSHKHIYAQLIDDKKSQTLAFSCSLGNSLLIKGSNQEAAFSVGQNLALKAKQKEISNVVFDRGNFKYHGRIKSLAEGARKEGLNF